MLAVFRDVTRLLAVGDHDELIARLRQSFQSDNFHRRRRRRFLQRLAAIVEHGTYFSVHIPDHEVVARVERAVLHQNRAYRAAAAIQFRFEHYAARRASQSRFQFLQVGGQTDHFHQQIQIRFLLGGNVDEYRRATPLFGHQSAIRELLLDPLRQRSRLIDLVYRNNNGNFGGVRVVDGFNRLRHDAVVGRGDQHHDVGCFRSACAHARERFVTRRIQEHNLAPVSRRRLIRDANFVGADMLRDAARLASGHIGGADGIEQGRLAVVDVAHDGDHRRTRHGFRAFLAALGGCIRIFRGLFFEGDDFRLRSEEARHFTGQFRVEGLIDGGEYSTHHQTRNHILGANAELLGQVFHRDPFGNGDVARDRRGLVADDHARRRSVALHRAFLHTSRHISLSRPSGRSSRTGSRTNRSRRGHSRSRTYAQRTRSGGRHARWMHRPPFPRT